MGKIIWQYQKKDTIEKIEKAKSSFYGKFNKYDRQFAILTKNEEGSNKQWKERKMRHASDAS